MRPFVSATITHLKRDLLHREFWLGLIIGRILPIMIPLFAWQALFAYTGDSELQGWSSHDMNAYYLIVFFLSVFADTNFHYQLSDMVHLGTLNQWLIRPPSFAATIAGFLSARILILFLPGLLILGIGTWLITDFPSASPLLSLMIAGAVVPLSLVMFCLLSTAIGLSSFWLMKTNSIFALTMLLLEFFGGRLLPLPLLPSWLASIGTFLPLRFAISLPAEAILHPRSAMILPILMGQFLWCGVLLGLAMLLWNRGLRRFDAVGG